MSLSTRKHSKHRSAAVDDDFVDRDDNVTYSSVNSRDKKSFAAVSPTNSHHAAKLAKLAMAVQENQRPPAQTYKGLRSRMPALLTGSAAPRGQESIADMPSQRRQLPESQTLPSAYVPADQDYVYHDRVDEQQLPAGTQPAYYRHQSPVEEDGSYTTAASVQPTIPSRYPTADVSYRHAVASPAVPQHQVSRVAPTPVFQDPPEVTRYSTEHKTTYKVKSHHGKVRVSAPVGSNEAQLFDAVAEANSHKAQEPTTERGVVRRDDGGSGSGRRGWLWNY